MRETVDILGQQFRAVPFDHTRAYEMPCVYLMAHCDAAGAHCIHYAGQTENLAQRFAGHHQLAAAQAAGATHVLVLVVRDYRLRRALETVLRWHFRPPVNEEECPTHMQGWRAAQVCGLHEVADRARAAHLAGARSLLPAWAKTPKAG